MLFRRKVLSLLPQVWFSTCKFIGFLIQLRFSAFQLCRLCFQRRFSARKFRLFIFQRCLAGCQFLLFIGDGCFRTEKFLLFVCNGLFSVKEFLFFLSNRLLSVKAPVLCPLTSVRRREVPALCPQSSLSRRRSCCTPSSSSVFASANFCSASATCCFASSIFSCPSGFDCRIPPVARRILERFNLRLYSLHPSHHTHRCSSPLPHCAVRLDVNLCIEIRGKMSPGAAVAKAVDASVSNRARSPVPDPYNKGVSPTNNRKRVPVSESESGILRSGSGTLPDLRSHSRNFSGNCVSTRISHPLSPASVPRPRAAHSTPVRQRNQLHNLLALADVMQHFHPFFRRRPLSAIRLRGYPPDHRLSAPAFQELSNPYNLLHHNTGPPKPSISPSRRPDA